MSRISIDLVHQAMVDLIAGSAAIIALGFKANHIFYEGDELEVGNIAHMPLINVRLIMSEEDVTSIPNGTYEKITFSVDVFVFDFTSFRSAAKLRAAALSALKILLSENRQFQASLQTSSVALQTGFGQGTVDGQRGHIAVATVQIVCEAYND